jgi:Protein of unknown function (DUF1569)
VKTLARPRDKAEILERLRALRPESRRRWGRMSAPQAVCHLSDTFLAFMGRHPVSKEGGVLGRTVVKWIALYTPLPWPRGVVRTRPEIDQECGGTRPSEFAADVAQLEALVEQFAAESRSFQFVEHPVFGPLTDAAWLRWGYRHMDHHLRQFGA